MEKQQLLEATNTLPDISHCFTSPLIRCHEFALEYCQDNDISLQVSAQLQEMNFGDWDGQSYQTLWQAAPTLDKITPTLGAFWQNPWQCLPPNGESMENFISRVDDFWQSLLKSLSETHVEKGESSNTLVFSHGGVIRYLLAKVLRASHSRYSPHD